jgi:magnesium chelatase subunit I
MSERANFSLLPYSYIVRQDTLRWLLEVAYVMGSSVGGVLVSGERGTAKSTIVRSFATMMHNQLPVTLPINATDDRVMGGWQIDALMRGNAKWQDGLLEQAAGDTKMLYIDEVNLLDDHIINLILDVVSTGLLVVEREGMDNSQVDVSFMLVGTMNPEEGALRPQLLDRFGLFVPVNAEQRWEDRREILLRVLKFDTERDRDHSDWLEKGKRLDGQRRAEVERAKAEAPGVLLTNDTIDLCARVATEFDVVGHRGEIVMAEAARAAAALAGRQATTAADVSGVAPYAVMHRRRDAPYADGFFDWLDEDVVRLKQVIPEG